MDIVPSPAQGGCVFIYALTDPRDGLIRYVGKTKSALKARLTQHVYSAVTWRSNAPVSAWIRDIFQSGLNPGIFPVDTCAEEDWQDRECYWIHHYRAQGAMLLNATDGGNDMGAARTYLGNPKPRECRPFNTKRAAVWLDSERLRFMSGKIAMISSEDYPKVSAGAWHLSSGAAVGYVGPRMFRRHVLMHRLIMDAPPGVIVDHINGNRLDNRRCNLRLCDAVQNSWNRRPQKGRRYKGVHFYARYGNYQVSIRFNGRQLPLGYFPTAEEAARVYDNAARFYFGEYACTNLEYAAHDPIPTPAHPRRGTSKYRGVCYNLKRGAWVAQVTVGSVHHHLGRFATESDALAAYESGCDRLGVPEKKNPPNV